MTAHEHKSRALYRPASPAKRRSAPLTGRGQFVDDISLPGMLHVAFARSPIARGNILSINTQWRPRLPVCTRSSRSRIWRATKWT